MRITKKTIMNEKGFTLLEVMIAMAIFSIGILGTVAMQYLVVAGNTSGNVVNQQLLLAQQILEEKKNGTDVTAVDTSIPAGMDTGPYNVEIDVANPIGGAASRFIAVTVSKPGIGGHPITVRTLSMGNGI